MLTDALRISGEEERPASLEALLEFLRFKSISSDPNFAGDVSRCATWLVEYLHKLGFDARLITVGQHHPIVYAEWLGAGDSAPTVLLYGHYDVQPPDPLADWTTPPFDPQIRDERIWARGAMDDKGQVWSHIAALAACLKAGGRLPVNYKIMLEGEEECGSEGIHEFLRDPANIEMLRADVVLVSDTEMEGPGRPAICRGLRGMCYAELKLRGPSADRHSGHYGGVIRNPATVLVQILGRLQDMSTGQIRIPEIYDDLAPVSPAELALMQSSPPDPAAIMTETGSSAVWNQPGVSLAEAAWHRPTLDVHGLTSGYQGEGPKTIIPAWASAKISMRLGPGQDPQRVFDCLKRYIQSIVPAGIECELRHLHGGRAFLLDPTLPLVHLAKRALAEAFGAETELTRTGGSIPIAGVLQEQLGVPVLLIGLALPGSNIHSPNEWFGINELQKGSEAIIRFMCLLAESRAAA